MNINDRLAVVPRNVCVSCWKNIVSAVYYRINLDLNPEHIVLVLSEFCSNYQDGEGNFIAISESSQHTATTTHHDKVLDALYCFLNTFSIQTLLTLLDNQNLSAIGDALCVIHSLGVVEQVTSAKFHDSRRLQQFYYRLKNFFDNNVINEENKFLRNMFYIEIRNFEDMEGTELQHFVNKFALITWLRIQQCKRDTGKIRKVLNICLKNLPTGVDQTLALAIYYSKMAVADALDGNASSSIHNLHCANSHILLINDPVKVLFYHDRRYVYQLLGKHANELHNATNRALAILDVCDSETNSTDFVTQMKRMFLLYASQYLLGIGKDLKANVNVVPPPENMLAATGVLHSFENTMQTGIELEPRRLMIYDMCKAKFLVNGDRTLAGKHLDRALECAVKGAKFGEEKQNIEAFRENVRRQTEDN